MRPNLVTLLGLVLMLSNSDAAQIVLPEVNDDVLPLSADHEETVISRSSNSTEELPDALHYLPMDEIDDNIILGTINGTLKNGPHLVEGVVGKALHFNGNSQSAEFGFLRCFSDLEHCGSNKYTTAMWLRLDTMQGERYILSSGGQTSQSRAGGIAVVTKGGKLKVEIRSYEADKAWVSSGLTVFPDEWFHLAAVWDGSVMKVYQNGHLEETVHGSTTHWAKLSFEHHMYLGRPNNSDKPRFDGKFTIDEWHYWNNLLSDKDIHNVYMIKNFVQQKQDCI